METLFLQILKININYYENTGSSSSSEFTLVDDHFLSIDIGSRSAPFFFDYDGDGDLDLGVGSSNGIVSVYRNESQFPLLYFVLVSENYENIHTGSYSSPTAGDIDDDGDWDIISGNGGGGLLFYRGLRLTSVEEDRSGMITSSELNAVNYPNPFNSSTVISFELRYSSDVTISIFDISGHEMENIHRSNLEVGTHKIRLNAKSYPTGIYIYKLDTSFGSQSGKMLLIK